MWGEVTYPITSVVCKKKAAVVGIPGQSGLHETISKKKVKLPGLVAQALNSKTGRQSLVALLWVLGQPGIYSEPLSHCGVEGKGAARGKPQLVNCLLSKHKKLSSIASTNNKKVGVRVHACDFSTEEVETGESWQFNGSNLAEWNNQLPQVAQPLRTKVCTSLGKTGSKITILKEKEQ